MKKLTETWQDAVKMMTHCKINGIGVNGGLLQFQLKDPVGQEFLVNVVCNPIPRIAGNVMMIDPGFTIEAYDPKG